MIISVALCTYNGAQFIERQLQSILQQTVPVDEIVICDDGSMDGTAEIIHQVSGNTDIAIRYCRNETNLGVCANFHKAVSLCKGDIVFFSDQDDIWFPFKVERVKAWFGSHPDKHVVFTNAELVNDKDNGFTHRKLFDCVGLNEEGLKSFQTGFALELFCRDNRATGATMAFRGCFQWDERYCSKTLLHDEWIALLAMQDNKLGLITDCLMQYRIHQSQAEGLKQWIDSPIGGNPLEPSPSCQRYLDLPLCAAMKDRVSFNYWRSCLKHSVVGPIQSMLKYRIYRRYYGKESSSFMWYDICSSVRHTLTRMKRIIIG